MVSDGQRASATTFNNAFLSRTQDSDTVGVVGLNNTTDPNSGNHIFNTQRLQNETADSDGTAGEGDATRKVYSSSNVVSSGDNRKVAIGKLDAKFNATTGHSHTGAAGDAPKLDYIASLTGTQLKGFLVQGTQLTGVTGTSKDVSTQLTGEANSTGQTVQGVVSTAPYNIVQLLDTNDNNFEDAFGNKVYGRLTFAASVWTLSFYSLIAGVETAYTFSSSTVNWYYQKLFTESNRPVYSDQSILVSNLLAGEVPDASATVSGKVNVSPQTFAGKKTFGDGVKIQSTLEIPKTDSASPGTGTLTYHPFIRVTGSGGDVVQGITAGADGKSIIIHNSATTPIILNNQSGSASAADRLLLPNAADINLDADSSIELIYDSTASRWIIKSGSGSGSSSASSVNDKNFITNPDFTASATGYATFADAAAASPVDGTGGSPNSTFVRSTSSPLRGVASGLLTKGAANRQGEGFSYDLTIDPIDAGKELILSGEFSFSANYVAGDVGVWVYDITNNTLLTPYPVSGTGDNGLNRSSGRYLFAVQSTSSTSYRVIWFIKSTNSLAWTGKFDNLFFGSTTDGFVLGPNVSSVRADLSVVPNSAVFGTIGNTSYLSWREGQFWNFIGYFTLGTYSAGVAKLTLPNGFAIDSISGSKTVKFGEAFRGEAGTSGIFTSGIGMALFYDGSDPSALYFSQRTSASQATTYDKNSTFASGDSVQFHFRIPIQGWSPDIITANSRVFKISDFLATGTRVTSTPANLGEYRSYVKGATSTAGSDNAPSQTAASMGADGFRLYTVAYTPAGTSGQPNRVEMFIGKNKNFSVRGYSSAGRVGEISFDRFSLSSTEFVGLDITYNDQTGVIIFDGMDQTASTTDRDIGKVCPAAGAGGTYPLNAYVDVIVSDNPLPVQVDLEPVYIKDVKASGTAGGSATAGSWITRDLNTLENPKPWVTLSSNQFTLDSGKYEIEVLANGTDDVRTHKAKLYNVTDSANGLIGTTATSTSADGQDYATSLSVITGVFTISGTKTFEVRHQVGHTSADGFGIAASLGVDEIYTVVKIRKLV